jgi:hypothetical protein
VQMVGSKHFGTLNYITGRCFRPRLADFRVMLAEFWLISHTARGNAAAVKFML